ncbi:hypothetical protein BX604_5232 [Burkholderia sp. JKS000303]|nr:hypothetical protein BX604_5232 [Burkholderia sp. JKS000303]
MALRVGLDPNKQCGGCTVCCEALNIDTPELKKDAGVMCQNACEAGCSIYENRPDVCRTWYCLWRRIPDMPENCRPDKVRVLFSLDQHLPPRNPFERLYITVRALDDTADWDRPEVSPVIGMLAQISPIPVWLSFQGNKRLLSPPLDVGNAIMKNLPPTDAAQAEQIALWRQRLMRF